MNAYIGGEVAEATDPSTVRVAMPDGYPKGIVGLLTDLEQVRVDPDQPARVVIDEQSGVIVMGADVRISTVAIAQGNLTIRVKVISAFLALLVVTLALGGFALTRMGAMNTQAADVRDNWLPSTRVLGGIAALIEEYRQRQATLLLDSTPDVVSAHLSAATSCPTYTA